MSTENTQPSQAPESTEEKAKKPVPEEFFRQPYSFVRRGDRLTARRQKAWDTYSPTHVLDIPRLRTDTSVAPEATFDPVKIYGREAYQVVEIGSGLGEAIVHRAAEVPEANFLAVEVYTPGIADLLLKMGNAGVENVRVAQANAPELLDNMLEENSVDELWVFFPDPWHKSRHHKRRLVSPAFADKVARVLKPGGVLLTHDVVVSEHNTEEAVERLRDTIQVKVTPLTESGWTDLFHRSGFGNITTISGGMTLLSPKGLIYDEGWRRGAPFARSARDGERRGFGFRYHQRIGGAS